MIDRNLPATVPQQPGELQNLGRRQQPQNDVAAQEVEVTAVVREQVVQQSADQFSDFLNASQVTTELKAQSANANNVFDPVQEIERQSALQGYGSLGTDQAI